MTKPMAAVRRARRDLTSLWQDGQAPFGGSWNDIWRYTSKATVSYYKSNLLAGNHEFKAGFEHTPAAFIQGNGDRGKAGQYSLIFTGGATGQVGTPTQIELYNYPVMPQNNNTYTSVYGSDTWTIARRLTLELGGRFEHDSADIPKQCRQAGPWSFTQASCTDEIPFKTLNSFAPRLYFSYDITGDAKTVLKGGWGRFYKQRFAEENQMTNPFTSASITYRWHDLNGNRLYDARRSERRPERAGLHQQQPAGQRHQQSGREADGHRSVRADGGARAGDEFRRAGIRRLHPDVQRAAAPEHPEAVQLVQPGDQQSRSGQRRRGGERR